MRLLDYAKPAISGFVTEKHRQIGQIGPDESHRSDKKKHPDSARLDRDVMLAAKEIIELLR